MLDLRANQHYTLERLPAIRNALINKDAVFKCIYQFSNEFGTNNSPSKVNTAFTSYVIKAGFRFIFTSAEFMEFVSVDTILYLENSGVVIAAVLGDDENNYYINLNYLGLFTVPVAYQQNEFIKYKVINENTLIIRIAASFLNSSKLISREKDNDVIFIGRPYGNRPKLLSFLAKNGIDINIYGSKKWSKYFNSNVYKGFVDNSQYYQKIAKSKIVLALLESPCDEKLLHVNAKPFDAAKCSVALVTTRYQIFFDDYDLEEERDLLAYSTKEELLSKVKALISDDNYRNQISSNLRRKIKNQFDYDFTYSTLFSNIFSIKDSLPPVRKANILYVNNMHEARRDFDLKYDYVIFKRNFVQYSNAINFVISAHIESNQFVKIDSYAYGSHIRKIFGIVDLPSVAIPLNKLDQIKPIFSLVYIGHARQTYIPLNEYRCFNIYIASLALLRKIYKKFR